MSAAAPTGMSRTLTDGRFRILSFRSHIEQSIADILTTPIGSRVMRLAYGSRLFALMDRPVSRAWKLEVCVAVTEALGRWELRVRVKQVRVTAAGVGYVEMEIDCVFVSDGARFTSNQRVVK